MCCCSAEELGDASSDGPTPPTPESVTAAVQLALRNTEDESEETEGEDAESSDEGADDPCVATATGSGGGGGTSIFNPSTVFVGSFAMVRRTDQKAGRSCSGTSDLRQEYSREV